MSERWKSGTEICARYVYDGKVWFAEPMTIVSEDEDQFAARQVAGLIKLEEASAVRAESLRVIQRIESRAFNEPWPNWRPDPSWRIPELPDSWAEAFEPNAS